MAFHHGSLILALSNPAASHTRVRDLLDAFSHCERDIRARGGSKPWWCLTGCGKTPGAEGIGVIRCLEDRASAPQPKSAMVVKSLIRV